MDPAVLSLEEEEEEGINFVVVMSDSTRYTHSYVFKYKWQTRSSAVRSRGTVGAMSPWMTFPMANPPVSSAPKDEAPSQNERPPKV